MTAALDVGNTNIVLAISDGGEWISTYRVFSDQKKTSDEYRVIFSSLLKNGDADPGAVDKVIISSVVPNLTLSMQKVMSKLFGVSPFVVSRFAETKSMLQARMVQQDIIDTLFDDFGKYGKTGVDAETLRIILRFILSRVGEQISFNKNSIPGLDSKTITKGLEIFVNAGLIYPVYASACSTLPISASINLKRMKPLFVDTGVYLNASALDVSEFTIETDFRKLNIGNVCELSAGLELIKSFDARVKPELFFWTRDIDGSNRGTAEVDYVIQKGSSIIPIEVKARTQGGMKSLWSFLEKGTSNYGIRTSFENFSEIDKVKICPLYAIGGCRLF